MKALRDLLNLFEPPEDRRPLHPAAAVLIGIPIAVISFALLELMQLPLDNFWQHPARVVGSLFLAVRTAYTSLASALLFLLYAASLQLLTPSRPITRRAKTALSIALGLGVAAYHYTLLVEYKAFAGYPPFVAVTVLLGLFYGLFAAGLSMQRDGPRRRWLKTTYNRGIPLLSFAGLIGCQVGNYAFYRNQYPTLHLFTAQAAFLFLSIFIVWIVQRWSHRFRRGVPMVVAGVLVAHVLLLAIPLAEGGFVTARPHFAKHTMLGRTAHLLRIAPKARATAVDQASLVDPNGVARFAKTANLPKLKDGFKLLDYNVLLISVEALRFDATGLMRRNRNTPNMRKLAENGSYWFHDAHTPSCVTVQVFSSIFGMGHVSSIPFGLSDEPWSGRLLRRTLTVPEMMKHSGYNTFWVGHDLLLKGIRQGFQKVKRFDATFDDPEGDVKIVGEAIDTLKALSQSPKRFFGWIFFSSPHYPYDAHFDDMPDDSDKQRYHQEIRFVDQQLGKLLSYLETAGLMDQTVIIFHGDHGEEFREHGSRMHFNLFSEVTHVPLLIRIPGMTGKPVRHPTSVSYVFPWLLQYGDKRMANAAKKAIRRRIAPMMRETGGAVISELLDRNRMLSALRVDEHLLMYDHLAELFELYDQHRDPKEKRDIFGNDAKRTEKFEGIGRRFLAARAALEKTVPLNSDAEAKDKKKNKKGKTDKKRAPADPQRKPENRDGGADSDDKADPDNHEKSPDTPKSLGDGSKGGD